MDFSLYVCETSNVGSLRMRANHFKQQKFLNLVRKFIQEYGGVISAGNDRSDHEEDSELVG